MERDRFGNWVREETPEQAKARRWASRVARGVPALRLVRRDGNPLGTVTSQKAQKKRALRARLEAAAGHRLSARQLRKARKSA